jgi:hypothetical protein
MATYSLSEQLLTDSRSRPEAPLAEDLLYDDAACKEFSLTRSRTEAQVLIEKDWVEIALAIEHRLMDLQVEYYERTKRYEVLPDHLRGFVQPPDHTFIENLESILKKIGPDGRNFWPAARGD